MSARARKAPFPWFGGKSTVADYVWRRLGSPKQYIEPFCGSAAILLAAPTPASLEVIGDANCYVANFWRALKFGPDDVTRWQDYPVSHIDLAARHRWLTDPARVAALRKALVDPEWPGDPHIAGWWLWGQCCWVGTGWCDPDRRPVGIGKSPRVTDGGVGIQSPSGSPTEWLLSLADRLARVRVVHADWRRCLAHDFAADPETAVFLDPPYLAFEKLYSDASAPVAASVAAWAREHGHLRVALCGHVGDYDMPGWDAHRWSRARSGYGGSQATRDAECIWFSPGCLPDAPMQASLFGGAA